MESKLLVLLAVSLFTCAVIATTDRSDAKITSLPGLTFTPNFDQYSGYITLSKTTKNIFYWFVESQNDPANDPVVLWLQGGPGCSDFGGMFEENGPYLPVVVSYNDPKQVNLTFNPYSWNTVANMIYIDSPCGVGFSYGQGLSDKENSDNGTAIDTYVFLQQFFDIYSEFSGNDFYITGESYAGVYITNLAFEILSNNSAPTLKQNLENGGIMLGNPVTNCGGESYNGPGNILALDTQVNNFYWHGMVSRRDYDNWNAQLCNTVNPTSLAACFTLFATIRGSIGHLDQPLNTNENTFGRSRVQASGSINPDMLYFSYCVGNGTIDFVNEINPNCFSIDDQVSTYLNDPAVQAAIHAQPTNWGICGGVLYNKSGLSVIPHLNYFFSNAPTMRVQYYSGDLDIATVPFGQTQRCLETLNRPITHAWRPWTINKEVAGYVEEYDTYTWVTVKGAGHEAPEYQPASCYLMFTTFLQDGTLPH